MVNFIARVSDHSSVEAVDKKGFIPNNIIQFAGSTPKYNRSEPTWV
jgi:hypothetical protein